MSEIKSFKDLEVYQLANQLAIEIYKLSESFPKDERFGLIDQLRRAVTSIGANIAEGFGRYHTRDFVRFLYNARGSLFEVNHFLIFAELRGFIEKDVLIKEEEAINKLGIKLNNLIAALLRQVDTRNHEKSQKVTREEGAK